MTSCLWGNWSVSFIRYLFVTYALFSTVHQKITYGCTKTSSFLTQILITIDNTEYKACVNKRLYCRDKFSLLFCEIWLKLTCFVCATWALFSTDEVQNVFSELKYWVYRTGWERKEDGKPCVTSFTPERFAVFFFGLPYCCLNSLTSFMIRDSF